jgi:hypothetical protein
VPKNGITKTNCKRKSQTNKKQTANELYHKQRKKQSAKFSKQTKNFPPRPCKRLSKITNKNKMQKSKEYHKQTPEMQKKTSCPGHRKVPSRDEEAGASSGDEGVCSWSDRHRD